MGCLDMRARSGSKVLTPPRLGGPINTSGIETRAGDQNLASAGGEVATGH